jgi:uncharacterized protein YqgC (DUF456 family)
MMPLGLLDYRVEQRLGAPTFETPGFGVWTVLSLASAGVSAYHGSKRHGGSIGWGVAWGLLGGLFPILTPAIGAAQGFGTCKYDCR